MEKAVHLESASALKTLNPKNTEFSRLYFGSETCETKLPTTAQLSTAKAFCKKPSLAFSLVTPFCTDAGIKKIQSLLPLLSPEDELIANDFGVLSLAQTQPCQKVAGRLLNKQFRDPRIAFFKNMPAELAEHFSQSQASSPNFQKLLTKFSVKRVELDNLLQGISSNFSNTAFKASLYHPIVFVSATRLCLLANAGKISSSNRVGIFPCKQECNSFKFRLTNKPFPKQLLLLGNALFFENSSLPTKKQLASQGIDRLVTNKTLAQ